MKTPDAVRDELEDRGLLPMLYDVCSGFHLLPLEVCGRDRKSHVVAGRHALWKRLREETGWSYPAIAKLFGVDHTTVLMACRKEW